MIWHHILDLHAPMLAGISALIFTIFFVQNIQPSACVCTKLLFLSLPSFTRKLVSEKNKIRFINTWSWRHRRDALADLTILGLVLSWKYETARLPLNRHNWPKNFTMWMTSSPLTVCKAGGLNESIVFQNLRLEQGWKAQSLWLFWTFKCCLREKNSLWLSSVN